MRVLVLVLLLTLLLMLTAVDPVQDDVHALCGSLSRLCLLQSIPGGQVLRKRCMWEGVFSDGYSG